MRTRRTLYLCFLSLPVLLMCLSAKAQQADSLARINAPVDDSVRTTLKGNVSALATPRFDQGAAEPSAQLSHMRLVLSRTAEQQQALDKYLADLLDTSSRYYHRWLTPEQFGVLYGPGASDIATLTSWLESHGLKLESVANGRTNITFSGTVGQVEETFHTPIHSFVVNGEHFYSNTRDPQIPSAFAGVVSGIAHLNTIHPKSAAARAGSGVLNPETNRLEPLRTGPQQGVAAELTLGSSSSGYFLYIVPGDAATIYDTPNTTFNANYTTGTSYSGSGVKIGIGGETLIQASTVADYRTRFIGDSTAPTIVNVDGVTSTDNPGALDEAYLDTELSAGLAPGASIYFYTSKDLFSAVDQAVNANTVDIFSLSFGERELDLSTADNTMISQWWQQAATQGMTVTVSTGDNGSAGCDATEDNSGNNVTAAVGGLAVNGLGSTPYNVAVGGTDMIGLSSSFTMYASTSQGSSSTFYRTALNYIPESTWNDSTTLNETISENAPLPVATGQANIAAGSGGVSSCSTNTTVDTPSKVGVCNSGYSKPVWQRGVNVPVDGVRDLPDVALMAGNGNTPASWLVCSDDTTTNSSNVTVAENCTKQPDGKFYFVAYGGTSTATPAFAGILALVEQSTGGRLGQAAKNLYDLYNGAHAAAIFHDTTVGNNSVPCASNTPNCVSNSAGNDYLTGYNTTPGYDLATGLGSVDVRQLVTYWSSSTGAAAATIAVTPSLTTITPADALSVAVTLTGAGAAPTGNVTLTGGGYQSISEPLVSGAFTFSIPAGSLDVGTDTLSVSYGGDVTYASSTGTAVVTVTGPVPTVTVVPSAASIPSSSALTLAATVVGTGATPTGTVTLSGAFTSSPQALVNGAFAFSIAANTLTTGTQAFTVTYSGDQNYAAATGTASVIVTASVATFTMSPATGPASPASVAAGGTAVANISVSSPNGYAGTVTFTCMQTAGPANASGDAPLCEFAPTLAVTSTAATVPFSVITIAPVAASELFWPKIGGKGKGLSGAGAGAVLALLLFIGVPAKRRKWLSRLSMLLALAALGSLAACGGGGGGTKTPANPGSAAGAYTFTVSATGDPAPATAPAAVTFTVTVTN